MSKKQWSFLAVIVALVAFSVYLNRDRFARAGIQIIHRSRPDRLGAGGRNASESRADPVIFGLNRPLRLTSIKVIPLAALQTNQYAQPIWHLTSDSNSVPVTDFTYGGAVQGMRPASEGASADPLEPRVQYRLFIEADAIKATHDFSAVPKAP